MAGYVIAAIWMLSNFLCAYLIKKRNLKLGIPLTVIGVILGPFAIPLIFTIKPKVSKS